MSPSILLANVGIPLLGPVIALGWFPIVPVVILESLIAVVLLKWRFSAALGRVASANVFSMILGIPVVWFLAVLCSPITGGGGWGDGSVSGVLRGPAWLGPGYIEHIGWAVPLGLIVLCVPFYLVSWWVEFAFLRFAIRQTADSLPGSLWAYTWKANLASYALLVVLLVIPLIATT